MNFKFVDGPWIEFNDTFKKFDEAGLCVAGTMVQDKNLNELLIGHVNLGCGGCNCCQWIRNDEIVTKYRIVLVFEDDKNQT